jgi:hypothetical protein
LVFVLVVIVPRQIGRGTACAGADMRCRDSSGGCLECDGEKAVLGFINLLPRLKQLVDQFMKSNRATVVFVKKILRKIIRGVLELVAMKQRRD